MPLPSLYISGQGARAWNVTRAAGYGAIVGALAASFKAFGLHRVAGVSDSLAAGIPQIVGATLAFALLCGGAAMLRNLIARQLIWPEIR